MLAMALILSACSSDPADKVPPSSGSVSASEPATEEAEEADGPGQEPAPTALAKVPQDGWQYNETDDVYWQVGVLYCEKPVDEAYETLGIFVPGAYLSAQENGDGTYTCTVKEDGAVGNYTAQTAPIVLPVNTPGYSAMAAPTGYVSEAGTYADAGFVYINAGCRGRDAGAPAGVTDLKAAVRYIRYSADTIPGSTEHIFSFGMSGGGAQSALLGSTGDSELYTPYLETIGAVQGFSDAVFGSMCWCPITNLDYANEAYEWNLGVSRSGLDEETQALSDGMAEAFALYINELGLEDGQGNILTLESSDEGIYQAGSYYDYLKSVIEDSLNHFLSDTAFPYSPQDAGFGGRDGNAGLPGSREGHDRLPDGNFPDGGFPGGDGQLPQDGIQRREGAGGLELSGTYETVQDYIDALNANRDWVSYDAATNTATITSIEDFVLALKTASKDVGAFDDLNGAQGENILLGYGDGQGAHFDPVMAELLAGTEYGDAYAVDLARTDTQGNTVDVRMNMYNPMYYLSSYYDGYGSSKVASCWRIRTGIQQGDTALAREVNLALALEKYGADVDFETVWGQGHTQAERTGTSTENFVQWVDRCMKVQDI